MDAAKQLRQLEKRRKRKGVPESEYLTQMRDPENALEIEDLQAGFFTDDGLVRSVDGVSFDIPAGQVVGVVGESGCGKSVTGMSLLQLLQRPQGQILGGKIRLNLGDKAYDIAKTPESVMRTLRGSAIAMIFQEPMTALNPVFTVGRQIAEVIALHDRRYSTQRLREERVLALLELVGIANGRGVYRMYPHELSGGMRQRICIAMALACDPKVIVADEPTTALDVTIQAQILELLGSIRDRVGSAIMLVTHDLGVVAGLADLVVVMYAGRVVERGTVREIFRHPTHPYTRGLMASKPVVGKRTEQLYAIGGRVPNPLELPKHCYFRERCDRATEECAGDYPCQVQLSDTHFVSCYRSKEK